jgi:hypothetical protein
MLRSPLVYAGLSLSVLLGCYVVGCGDDESVPVTDQTGRQPPGPPDGAPNADGSGQAYAVSKLYLGGSRKDGTPDPNAWKDIGYNLDKKISTAESTDLCRPAAGGAKQQVYPDGNDGIDNAFGKILLPVILSLAPDAETSINDSLGEGSFTVILNHTNLGDGANYLNLLSKLYAGQDLGNPPANDGTDVWPVAPELPQNPDDIESSKVQFPNSYVNNNVWVSGSPGTVTLSVAVQGFQLALVITQATISMQLAEDHQSASNGVIAGVLEVEPFLVELQKIAGSLSPELCDPNSTLFQNVAASIRGASDILTGGLQDPNQECNAISIGIGFDAVPVSLGAVAPPSEPGEDPCNEGGGGAGAEGGGGTNAGGEGGQGGS